MKSKNQKQKSSKMYLRGIKTKYIIYVYIYIHIDIDIYIGLLLLDSKLLTPLYMISVQFFI